MRILPLVALALVLVISPGVSVGRETPAPDVPPQELARWVRSGSDVHVREAAKQAATLGPEGLRALFQEIRDLTRVHDHLSAKHIQGLQFEDATLDTALSYLATITGLSFYVTPKARKQRADQIAITLAMKKLAAKKLLDLICHPHGLRWAVRKGIVTIGLVEELAPLPADPAAYALRRRVDATTIRLQVQEAPLSSVVKTLIVQTGLNLVIDPRVDPAAQGVVRALSLRDVSLTTTLNMLAAMLGDDGTWAVRGNTVLLTTKTLLARDK